MGLITIIAVLAAAETSRKDIHEDT
jgi:hypothetical protein